MIALIDGLLRKGWEVEIFELQGVVSGQASFEDEAIRRGVRLRRGSEIVRSEGVDHFEVSGFDPFVPILPREVATICAALGSVIEEFRPNVVHCWSDLSNVIGGFLSSTIGVPRIVLSQRTLPPPYWFDALQSELYRAAYRKLAGSPAVRMLNNSIVSMQEFERWMGIAGGRIKLIYNGFLPSSIRIRKREEVATCRVELGLPVDAPVVGVVMRFAPEKDPDLWLETAAHVAKARPDAHFLLSGYGHGDVAKRLSEKAAQLGLAEP